MTGDGWIANIGVLYLISTKDMGHRITSNIQNLDDNIRCWYSL